MKLDGKLAKAAEDIQKDKMIYSHQPIGILEDALREICHLEISLSIHAMLQKLTGDECLALAHIIDCSANEPMIRALDLPNGSGRTITNTIINFIDVIIRSAASYDLTNWMRLLCMLSDYLNNEWARARTIIACGKTILETNGSLPLFIEAVKHDEIIVDPSDIIVSGLFKRNEVLFGPVFDLTNEAKATVSEVFEYLRTGKLKHEYPNLI